MAFYRLNNNLYSLEKLAQRTNLDAEKLKVELDKGYSAPVAINLVKKNYPKDKIVHMPEEAKPKLESVKVVEPVPVVKTNYSYYDLFAWDRERIFKLMYKK